jgi:hypothetical protein
VHASRRPQRASSSTNALRPMYVSRAVTSNVAKASATKERLAWQAKP